MTKKYCLFYVILLSFLIGVNSLQCYVCFNCTVPSNEDLQTCGEVSTTTITTAQTTTTTPQTTTTTPQTTTTTPQTTTTTVQTTTTTPQTTTTTPQTTTTTPQTTTTTVQTTTTTQQTTTTTPQTTTTTPATTTATPATTTTIPETTTTEPEQTYARSKRSIIAVKSDLENCECRNKPGCYCDTIFSKASHLAEIEYLCHKVTVDVGNETIIVRGCVATVDGSDPCTNEAVKNITTSCSTCNKDKCNGSSVLQPTLLLLTAVGLLLWK